MTLPIAVFAAEIKPGDISAKCVYAYDADSGEVIFAKNENESCAEASATKLMTALLIIEGEPDLSKIYTVKKNSAMSQLPGDSSMMGLELGEKMSVKDMLNGMMMVSGNDAAIVLAENFSGSVSAFVNKMNQRAKELGMTKTTFCNPHGLENVKHRTTAKDFAKLATVCYKTPGFLEITNQKSYTTPATNKSPARVCLNTNRLLRDRAGEPSYRYAYANGMKTGSTNMAGYCLVASAEKDGKSVIIVMFGDRSARGLRRWPDCAKIFDYGFNIPVAVKSAKLNKASLTLKIKQTYTLKVTVSPSNAANKNVTWSSSNKRIATVTGKGVVKGVKKGTATITVKTANGKKATCKVAVK